MLGYYNLRPIETCQTIEKANVAALFVKVHPGPNTCFLVTAKTVCLFPVPKHMY